jgi:hypothetical protein
VIERIGREGEKDMDFFYDPRSRMVQGRFILEPIGQDYDGIYKPIDELFPNAPDDPLFVEEPKE